jgi:hypothetical protein
MRLFIVDLGLCTREVTEDILLCNLRATKALSSIDEAEEATPRFRACGIRRRSQDERGRRRIERARDSFVRRNVYNKWGDG